MKKVGKIILWVFAVVFMLGGIIGLTQGEWVGIPIILTGFCMLPVLREWIPIKVWQQVAACVILFIASSAFMPSADTAKDTVTTQANPSLSASAIPQSPSTEINHVFKVKFDSGDQYTGELKDNKPDGKGAITYTNLGTYDGTFSDGKRSGTGTFTWQNGDVYTGNWGNDQINGNGTLTFKDGTVLTASFDSNNIITGDYTWIDKNGSYILHVDNSSKEPVYTIKISYANGISYEGGFANGNLNGKGIMVYPDVGSYTGGFSDGKKYSNGQFTWNDGDKFSGVWSNDQMNGQGLYTFANGSTLSGTFKANVPKDTLIYTYQGIKYNTVWKNGTCTSISKV